MGVRNWQIWAGAGVAVAALAVVGSVAGGDGEHPSMTESDTYYRITSDMAGTFLTVGPQDGQDCHWARSSEPSGDLEHVIATGVGPPNRNTTVELHEGEFFITWGCRPWRQQ